MWAVTVIAKKAQKSLTPPTNQTVQWHTLYLLSVSMSSILVGDRNLTDDDKQKWPRLYCPKFNNQRRYVWGGPKNNFPRNRVYLAFSILSCRSSRITNRSCKRLKERTYRYCNPWTFLSLWVTANFINSIFATSLCHKVGTKKFTLKAPTVTQSSFDQSKADSRDKVCVDTNWIPRQYQLTKLPLFESMENLQ